MFLMTNHKPQMPPGDDDFAFWQRVHLIPFEVAFVEDPQGCFQRKIDQDLPEKLKTEAEGILAWMVRGCLKYQRQGLNPPEEIKAATRRYQKDEDILSQFIKDCCTLDEHANYGAGKLYEAFKDYCADEGNRPSTFVTFGKKMKRRFDWKISNGVKYLGIKLTE